MIQLTAELAVMYGREGIRANCVSPGHIVTPMVEAHLQGEGRRLRSAIAPLGIEGDAWDIAQAALFLAGAVLERLGIGSHFEDVFDIVSAELEPKPARQTYMKFLRLHGVDPSKAAMFEDLARNLVTPHDLGMTTVLVVPDGTKNVVREDWELEGRDAAYVDHITDDLTGFLAAIRVPN